MLNLLLIFYIIYNHIRYKDLGRTRMDEISVWLLIMSFLQSVTQAFILMFYNFIFQKNIPIFHSTSIVMDQIGAGLYLLLTILFVLILYRKVERLASIIIIFHKKFFQLKI